MPVSITQDVFGNPPPAGPAARHGPSGAPADAVADHRLGDVGRRARRGARDRPCRGELPRPPARRRRAAEGRRRAGRAVRPRPAAGALPLRPRGRSRSLGRRAGAVGSDLAGHAASPARADPPSRRSRRRSVAGARGLRGGVRAGAADLRSHARARPAPARRGHGPRQHQHLRLPARRWPLSRLAAGTFAYFLALGLGIPTVPRYLTGPLHGTPTQVGLAVAAFSVTAIAARPLVAPPARRVAPSALLIAGAGGVRLPTTATIVAHSVLPVVALRALAGAGGG